MKKQLLMMSSLFVGAFSFGQFTESNLPVPGDGATLYVIDSMAPAMENETGAMATWDYSTYGGYGNETRNLTAVDPTTTPHDTSFASSNLMIDIENFLQTYSSSTATEAIGHGFVFNEPSVGEIVARYNTDQANLMSFPMDENSAAINDLYTGELIYSLPFGGPQTSQVTGTVRAEVDGKGTLKLSVNDYTDVYRYKVTDTLNTNVTGVGDVQLVRVQYEYYDHTVSNLPIFTHTSIDFGLLGGAAISSSTLVMSLEDPAAVVGVDQNELAETSIYPVPATDILNVNLPEGFSTADVQLTDVQGRIVYTSTVSNSVTSIDVSAMEKGIYVLNISSANQSFTKNVVIK